MVKDNKDDIDLKDKSPEYRAGFTAGSIFAYVACGCICSVFIVIALKLMQWIWLL